MISIGHYVLADSQTEDTLLQLAQLLIQGIERNSVEAAPEEMARLRESTQRVLATLRHRTPPDELLRHAAAAVDALKHYNQHVVEYLQRPVEELQVKVKLLTDAIAAVSSTSSENIRRLQQIKGQMLSSVGVKDIRSLRMLLSECVDGVLAEAEHQRAKTDQAGEQLNRSSQRPSQADGDAPAAATDPTTGLPVRSHAEEVIAEACYNKSNAFAVVMVINQIQNVNRSLGHEVGDAMLQRFAGYVREQLPAVDQLFRWSGPTVVAMVRRRSMPAVRAVIEPMLIQRLTIKDDISDVQVPISTRWTVLPVMTPPQLLFQKMDSFADSE